MTNWVPAKIGGTTKDKGGAINMDAGANDMDDGAINMDDGAINMDDGIVDDVARPTIRECANFVKSTENYASNSTDGATPRRAHSGFRRILDHNLFLFLFFASSLSLAMGVHESYERVMCHPDYYNDTTIFDYQFKVSSLFSFLT